MVKKSIKVYMMSDILVLLGLGGYTRFKDGFQKKYPVEDYLDLFDWAAQNIQEGISGNSSGDHRRALITGEHMSKCLVWYCYWT